MVYPKGKKKQNIVLKSNKGETRIGKLNVEWNGSIFEVKEGIWEETTNTKLKWHSENHTENYYIRSFLKYVHIWKKFKWNHNIIGERMTKISILYYQVRSPKPWMCSTLLSHWSNHCFHWIQSFIDRNTVTKHHRQLQRLWLILSNLVLTCYHKRLVLFVSLNMEKSNWYTSGSSYLAKCPRTWD